MRFALPVQSIHRRRRVPVDVRAAAKRVPRADSHPLQLGKPVIAILADIMLGGIVAADGHYGAWAVR